MYFQIEKFNYGNKEILLSHPHRESNDNHTFTLITGKNGVGKSRLLVSLVSTFLSNQKNSNNLKKVIAVSNIRNDKFPERNIKFNNYYYIGSNTKSSYSTHEKHYLFKNILLNKNINTDSLCHSFRYLGFKPIIYLSMRQNNSVFPDKRNKTLYFLEMFKKYYNFIDSSLVTPEFLSKFHKTNSIFSDYPDLISESISANELNIESFETINFKTSRSNRHNFIEQFSDHLKKTYDKNEIFFFECLLKLSLNNTIIDYDTLNRLSNIILELKILPHLKDVVFNLQSDNDILLKDASFLLNLDLIKIHDVKLMPNTDNKLLEFYNLSSGQQSLFNILLGISSAIENNSLICIDEPEVNLHPEWQNEFIIKLQNIFNHISGCHFVIATHSPQIISGLTSSNGFVVDLENNITHTVNEYSQKSADYQLAHILGYPGHNNEYLIRIGLTLLSKITNKIDLDNLDKHNLNILNNSRKDLPKNDPVSFLIEQINALV